MDSNRLEGNWKQIKGKVKEQWGKLTDDDLTAINGQREQLEGKIQERYGIQKDQVGSRSTTGGPARPGDRLGDAGRVAQRCGDRVVLTRSSAGVEKKRPARSGQGVPFNAANTPPQGVVVVPVVPVPEAAPLVPAGLPAPPAPTAGLVVSGLVIPLPVPVVGRLTAPLSGRLLPVLAVGLPAGEAAPLPADPAPAPALPVAPGPAAPAVPAAPVPAAPAPAPPEPLAPPAAASAMEGRMAMAKAPSSLAFMQSLPNFAD